MGVLITLAALVAAYYGLKLIWLTGFLAGKNHEAAMWLASIDKLFVPNWQSLPIGQGEGLTKEQLEMANKVYSAAYRTALDHIKLDIAIIRQEAVNKWKAKQSEVIPS